MEELDFIRSSCVCNGESEIANDAGKSTSVERMCKDLDECCSCVYDRLTYVWRKKTFNHWRQVIQGGNATEEDGRQERSRSRASSSMSRSRYRPRPDIVVPYLRVDEIYRLTFTNKSICREVGRATHTLSFIPARKVILDENMVSLPIQFPHLKEVNLTGCSSLTDESVTDKCLTLLTDSQSNSLTSLNLGYCKVVSDEGIAAIATNLPKLNYLSLRGCNQVGDNAIRSLARLKNLQTLNLWYCNQGALTDVGVSALAESTYGQGISSLSTLVNLRHLEIANVGEVTDRGLLALAPLINLITLDVAGCYNITDSGTEVLANFQKLASCNLWYCSEIGDATFQHMESLTKMRFLNFMKCGKVTDRGLQSIAKLRNLTSLDMVSCFNVTDEGLSELSKLHRLKSLASQLSSLVILDLSNCRQVGNKALLGIGELHSLINLNLMRCNRIDDDGIAHLARLTRLKTLNLANCRLLTDTAIKSIAQMTKLETLVLWYCNKLTDVVDRSGKLLQVNRASLAAFLNMPNLTSLDLGNCCLLSDEGMITLGKVTSLTSLNLSECGDITDAGLEHLKTLDNLTSINLWYCTKVTPVGINHLPVQSVDF
ncbi:Leucine-rich repeat domain, L domain-like [Phytophthora cactorum]|nr:Leucine-rich repeat domain, L domain-like [Phytophthora cactorum]